MIFIEKSKLRGFDKQAFCVGVMIIPWVAAIPLNIQWSRLFKSLFKINEYIIKLLLYLQ